MTLCKYSDRKVKTPVMTGDLERAAADLLSQRRVQEKELWGWMMSPAGVQRGMLFLEEVMKERTVVLG